MVRDLVSVAVSMVEKEKFDDIRPEVRRDVDKKLVKLLAPGVKKEQKQNNNDFMSMLNNMQNGSQPLGNIFNKPILSMKILTLILKLQMMFVINVYQLRNN
jgi:ATP-dependent protease HslVU (ClpYQ), ATPase subunit